MAVKYESSEDGTGVLRCRACGNPYRDHHYIGPCQQAVNDPPPADVLHRLERKAATKERRKRAELKEAVRR